MTAIQKYPVSVVVITKNEEKRLPDCLKSVAWASDIVVLDDESTDGTKAVATAFGARFIPRKMDIEGRHRNFGYAQAKEKWILSLDADERVTPELAKEIQTLFDKGDIPNNGYSIPRKNYIGSHWIRYGGWYPSQQLRLFKKDCFRYKEEEVHPGVDRWKGRPGLLKNDILHYSYNGFTDFISKLNRQTTLEARKWFRTGRKENLPHALWRSFDRFLRSFVKKKGYKDGFVGFMVGVFAALYQILSYAKYWELKRRDTHP